MYKKGAHLLEVKVFYSNAQHLYFDSSFHILLTKL